MNKNPGYSRKPNKKRKFIYFISNNYNFISNLEVFSMPRSFYWYKVHVFIEEFSLISYDNLKFIVQRLTIVGSETARIVEKKGTINTNIKSIGEMCQFSCSKKYTSSYGIIGVECIIKNEIFSKLLNEMNSISGKQIWCKRWARCNFVCKTQLSI